MDTSTIISLLAFLTQIIKAGSRPPDKTRWKQPVFENKDILLYGDGFSDINTHWEKGALSLVIQVLLGRIDNEEKNRIEDEDNNSVSNKIKGIYSFLKTHPALMDRRLYIGSKKPQVSSQKWKRGNFLVEFAEPVCPSRTEWQLLYTATDINDTMVEVFQPPRGSGQGQQWFYTVTCNNEALPTERDCPDCCIGIAHDRFSSVCSTRKSLTWALTRSATQTQFHWTPIQIDGGCNCAIQRRQQQIT